MAGPREQSGYRLEPSANLARQAKICRNCIACCAKREHHRPLSLALPRAGRCAKWWMSRTLFPDPDPKLNPWVVERSGPAALP